MTNEDKQVILATFDQCPNCGSKRRHMGELVAEQVKEKKIPEDTTPCLQLLSSLAAPPANLVGALVGIRVPTGSAILDACMDCGTIYATQLLRGEMMLQAVQRPPGVPFGGQFSPPFGGGFG